MGSELKPCPFCASLEVVGLNVYEYGGQTFCVECQSCMARTRDDCASRAEAVTLWNVRARVAELEAKLAESERRAEYWKAEHLAGNEVIAELESKLAAATKSAGEEQDGN